MSLIKLCVVAHVKLWVGMLHFAHKFVQSVFKFVVILRTVDLKKLIFRFHNLELKKIGIV